MEFLRSTGGRLSPSSLCYGPDGNHLFVALNNIILKLDGLTGVECDRLITKCYSISSIVLHPHDPQNKLIFGSERGQIECWDYVKKVKVGEGARMMDCSIKKIACYPGHDYFYINAQSNSIMKVYCASVKSICTSNKKSLEDVKFVCGYKKANDTWLTMSQDGKSLLCPSGIVMFIYDLSTDGSILNKEDRREVRYGEGLVNGCLLTDSRDNVFMCNAGGDICSRNIQNPNNNFTRHHWHPTPPTALSLTPDEKYMLSGGSEGVLVRWNINAPRQEFIPFLSSSIQSIICHPSGTVYVLGMESNNLIFIDAASFQPLPTQPVNYVKGECRFEYLPRDPRIPSNVLVNSIPGELQSIDPFNLKITDPSLDIDVSQQNNITWGGESQQVPSYCEVFAVATSPDLKWMATYDRLPSPKDGSLYLDTLRFWNVTNKVEGKSDRKCTSLTETIEFPHEAPIQNIYFAPTISTNNASPLCLTVGLDGIVKSWMLSSKGKWKYEWILSFKDQVCKAAAFSPDSSVLAITVNNSIHLFDCRNIHSKPNLMQILPCGAPSFHLKNVVFVADYLVAIDETNIYSWHLPTLSLRWSTSFPSITHIIPHPSKPLFYLAVRGVDKKSSNVFVLISLNPASYSPIQIISQCDCRLLSVALMTGSGKAGNPYLLLLNENRDFFIVGLEGKRPSFAVESVPVKITSKISPAVVEKEKEEETENAQSYSTPIILPRISRESLLMSTVPSHQLPSMEVIFNHYINYKLPRPVK